MLSTGSTVTNKSGAIPPAINLATININGAARSFFISWAPVHAEDGMRAYYRIEIEYQDEPRKSLVSTCTIFSLKNKMLTVNDMTLRLQLYHICQYIINF